jgi:hypothetical protein
MDAAPVQVAVRAGHFEIFKLLVQAGADLKVTDVRQS